MSKITTMGRTDMIQPKFYIARRNTRWDVYPQREPEVAIAHDWHGFWALTLNGEWFKDPTSYDLGREVAEAEAIAFHRDTQMSWREAVAELENVGYDVSMGGSDYIFINDQAGKMVHAIAVRCGAVQSDHVWAAVHQAVVCYPPRDRQRYRMGSSSRCRPAP